MRVVAVLEDARDRERVGQNVRRTDSVAQVGLEAGERRSPRVVIVLPITAVPTTMPERVESDLDAVAVGVGDHLPGL